MKIFVKPPHTRQTRPFRKMQHRRLETVYVQQKGITKGVLLLFAI